ncbi:MAG: hypothetical protein A2402_01360 [Candidatus Staskawiczbacteria bacterium RIFOXYC1_FULL_37_43]|nr:MAG: hypothetical protein A2813_02855 [Candidatus Staskawiczbacteria bacterium RIFCSPHIGHO2_01_FULL_37_17]OGZ71706.1 MAG: hypothetical protein A2891_00150 [Candidatus Staskawiczbacteria bacterium RIFCSPLOWO2_01_FULL_37_19]OGZ75400.1 MAG: hypothetical protein A2205_01500 [Candidatus Staskawiczbacteria bacterium RIFOXYA1_FULL_37_15]OGZ77991.1 MAG: hypothetical protein A2280_00180 [Candidatus Staskawiczbacteria bacterium RIFOXYA12_FULL_37_10]OGZ80851.1 MAG: hypothetical protein A2353_01265 [Can
MDFSAIFQLRTKKYWWMDVIFYLAISFLMATVFCYVIFIIKNDTQRSQLEKIESEIKAIATTQQKLEENQVVLYQAKIEDFATLLKNHEFASHAFIFMEDHTLTNVWFMRISIDRMNAQIQVSGETDNMETLSRQIAIFEKNEYVKSIDLLSSSSSESGMVNFNLSLALEPKIFSYSPNLEDLGILPVFSEQ